MLKFGIGRRPKPKGFDYIPRFYDPVKEDLEKRISKYKINPDKDNATNVDALKERIKYGMHNKMHYDPALKKKETKASNIRLVYIIFVLSLITYAILQSDKLAYIIQVLKK